MDENDGSIAVSSDALFYGRFPGLQDEGLVHSVQVYKSYESLCKYMRDPRGIDLIEPVMALCAEGSPTYSFGKCHSVTAAIAATPNSRLALP